MKEEGGALFIRMAAKREGSRLCSSITPCVCVSHRGALICPLSGRESVCMCVCVLLGLCVPRSSAAILWISVGAAAPPLLLARHGTRVSGRKRGKTVCVCVCVRGYTGTGFQKC